MDLMEMVVSLLISGAIGALGGIVVGLLISVEKGLDPLGLITGPMTEMNIYRAKLWVLDCIYIRDYGTYLNWIFDPEGVPAVEPHADSYGRSILKRDAFFAGLDELWWPDVSMSEIDVLDVAIEHNIDPEVALYAARECGYIYR